MLDAMTATAEQPITVGNVTLNVATAGPEDGPAVIFLHGFPDDWHEWRFQVDALAAAGLRCIAPDLPGCGASDRPPDVARYRLRRIATDVLGLLDHFEVERAHVVGHDFGAALAWHVALSAPTRVERLTVVSVGHPAANADAGLPQRARSWYMLWFLFPDVAEQVLPVMGVWSSGDFALGEEQMTGSARYLDGPWRYERIENVDHWVPVHAADRLAELLRSFAKDATK